MTAELSLNSLSGLSASIVGLVARTAPSIVAVHSHRAQSSGFVWKSGLIVTADEAVAEDGEITVTLAGGKRVPATIVGRDPTTDVMLLRATTGDAPVFSVNGTPPSVGALAVAVGGLDGDPVAALGVVAIAGPAWRSMRGGEIDARIELDLLLRRHAEGGIALNTAGHAFGMTVFGPRQRALVIPGATIARIAAQLETRGKIARGYLGLGLQPVRLDLEDGIGAIVMSVDADGPGAKAGVHQGDVIAAWNGKSIRSVRTMLRALGSESVGNTVELSLRRGGEGRTVTLVIGERP